MRAACSLPHAFGAWGKIPALGDFLRIAAPGGFVDAWDGWLQGMLPAARRDLGARWNACYLSAPIWRFTLGPGLAGRGPVMGVLMPSVDRVGRQFPLTLMAPLPPEATVVGSHLAAGAVFARLEDIALDALDRNLGRVDLLQRLSCIRPDAAEEPPPVGPLTVAAPGARPPGACLADWLGSVRLRRPALWSAVLIDGTRVLLSDGLPQGARAAALFDLSARPWSEATAA